MEIAIKAFNLKAVVSRQVVDDIVLRVHAESENVAMARAYRVLNMFPAGHDEEKGTVPACYIRHRATDHLEVLSITRDDDDAGTA